MTVGSSPDNAGAGRHYQTARVRQARWKGVTRVNQWLNQWLNPLKRETGSNLVDVGRTAVRDDPVAGEATPKWVFSPNPPRWGGAPERRIGGASSQPRGNLRVVFQTLALSRENNDECCEIDNNEWTLWDGFLTRRHHHHR